MNKPYVIGVAGGSASGKTTFAKKLKNTLLDFEIRELSMDSYFKPESDRSTVASPVSGKYYRDDNHPTSFDLPKLKQDLSELLQDNQTQIIIVEGLFTLWDKEIYENLDLRLFVECRSDERIVRRIKRNMAWGYTFDDIADVYLDLVRFRHDEYVEPSKWRADLIINGLNSFDKALKIITAYVRSSI